MNKSHLIKAFALFAVSALFALSGFLWLNSRQPQTQIGQLVFANAVNYEKSVDRISIRTTKDEFDIVMKNNYWHINGADGYFAGIMQVNDLLVAMNQTVFYSKQPFSPELLKQYGLDIQTDAQKQISDVAAIKIYSGDTLLNEIILGSRSENGLYTYAYIPGSENIWLISGQFTLPQYRYSWYQQPLFAYPLSSIKAVASLQEGNKSLLMRLNNKQDFVNKDLKTTQASLFLDEFKYVIFEDVKQVKDFDFEQYPQKRKLRITLFSDLTNELMLYSNGQKYWMTTKLSVPNLSTGKYSDYIESNKLLTDGWIFELPELSGKILFTSEV